MKIGLLSDTHGYLDPKIIEHFSACDEVWHAGDIGTAAVADTLENFKSFKAVFGNIDNMSLQRRFQEDLFFQCEELAVLITHIAGTPPRYNARVKKLMIEKKPDILICGHSHILRVVKDEQHNTLFMNPGAAGNQGFHHIKTIMRFDITGKEIDNMQVIELGKRGTIV